MSSRLNKRSKFKDTQVSYYPTEWSEWEWNSEQYERRYRLEALDQYQYQYRPAQTQSLESRSQASLNTIEEQHPTRQHPESGEPANYQLSNSPVDVTGVTNSLSHASLGPASSEFTSSNQYPNPEDVQPIRIQTKNPNTTKDDLDRHYKVQNHWDFKQGRVFKILWTEPRGDTADDPGFKNNKSQGSGTVTIKKGQFQEVRRFVIVKEMGGHCICLPIHTYSGKGVMKKGVNASHHTIVYSGKNPVYLEGEMARGLNKKPIKINGNNPRQKLHESSRLNYAKTYTVEYNVKIQFVGDVDRQSVSQLVIDYNLVHPPVEVRRLLPPSSSEDTYKFMMGGNSQENTPASQTMHQSPAPNYQMAAPSYQQPTHQSWTPNRTHWAAQPSPSLTESQWATPSRDDSFEQQQSFYPNAGSQAPYQGSTYWTPNHYSNPTHQNRDPRYIPGIKMESAPSHLEIKREGAELDDAYDPLVYDGPPQSGDDEYYQGSSVPGDSEGEGDDGANRGGHGQSFDSGNEIDLYSADA